MKYTFQCVAVAVLTCGLAFGQHYKVLYTFGTNRGDGYVPNGGLVFDKVGNLYGTTQQGGSSPFCAGCGTVFKLAPAQDGTWSESIIYGFCSAQNCGDGAVPLAGLVIDPVGNLYGTTEEGGTGSGCGSGCGTVFELSPPKLPGETWEYTVLWNFLGNVEQDGEFPASRLNLDAAGNLYGTTYFGGSGAFGTVFELSPVQGGGWTEQVVYSFCVTGPPTCADGYEPMAAVTFDSSGNLYGTTSFGGEKANTGVLFKLSPPQGGGAWTQTTLYTFLAGSGDHPFSPVNFDKNGNLYVTASNGTGQADGGSVLKFVPQPGGGKRFVFPFGDPHGPWEPMAGVFIDPRFSNLVYGTAENGGQFSGGEVYKLAGKTLTTLHSFSGSDGSKPTGSLTYHSGRLYSVTSAGGDFGQGVVFEITP
ncbi:MAG: choice-of-anchor tandem repeat GloVer-containing protein [Terriglobales bacterium]